MTRNLSLFGAMTLGLSATSATAATFVIPATADGHIQSSGVLGLTTETGLDAITTSRSGGNNVRHGIFEFDLSSIPAGSTILSAELTYTLAGILANTGGNPVPVAVEAYTGNGTVEDADYAQASATAASVSFALGSLSIGDAAEIDLTNLVPLQTAFDAAGSIVGLRTETQSFATFRVASLETTNPAFQVPTLTLVTIPEPSSLILVGITALGVCFRRRRVVS